MIDVDFFLGMLDDVIPGGLIKADRTTIHILIHNMRETFNPVFSHIAFDRDGIYPYSSMVEQAINNVIMTKE